MIYSKFRHIRNCYDIVYSSNSYGARDIERSLYSKAPRVIVLGDSFMEGMGVERGERLSEILENQLGIEHLNFGTSGHFGPVHEYLLYKHLAKKFNHEIIILGILPDNDFDDMDSQKRKDRYFPYFEGKYPDYQLKYSIRSLDKSSWKLGNPKDDRPLKHFLLNYTYTRNLYDYIGALLDNWSLGRNIRQGSYQKISSFVEYDSEKWDMMKYSYEKIIEEAACKKILFFTIPRMKDIWWYKENRTSPLGEKVKT